MTPICNLGIVGACSVNDVIREEDSAAVDNRSDGPVRRACGRNSGWGARQPAIQEHTRV